MPDGSTTQRLTDEQVDALAARLKAGEYLDEYLRPLLFRQAKEYELEYAAKTPKSRVLAETMAVPLQRLKQFGSPNGEWTNKLVFGDNLQVLKTLMEMKSRGELRNADGSEGIRLCYIDPPFATKREFRGSGNQRAYRDKIEGAAFVEFLRRRLIFITELLAEDGTLYLHLDTKKVHYMKVVLDELFGEAGFRNEIIWKRSDAHSDTIQGAQDYGRIHDTILRYTKGTSAVFNTQYLPLPDSTADSWYSNVEEGTGRRYNKADLTAAKPGGDTSYEFNGVRPPPGRYWAYSRTKMEQFRHEGRLVYAKSGRPYMKRYLDESRGVSLQDLWTDIGMLRGISTDGERTGYPTQKPVALLRRIIEVSSNSGDLVLDCFSGSGTTAVAAEHLGRRWIAVDCGKLAMYITQRQLLAFDNRKGKKTAAPAFDFCSAGLYDNDLVEMMPFEGFQSFCLDLFGCREQPQVIGGIRMAGTRKGGPVHFFPFKETDAEMGRDYIESLHGRLKGKVSGEVYVVAPVTACDPGLFEDVVVVDKITFFILRVPYSVIEALHGRRFKLLDQPYSAEMVNDPMDTFGFDFVQLPEVDVRYTKNKTAFSGSIRSFMRGGLDPDDFDELEQAGRLDLAMVLIDRDYDDEVFRVSDHFFGDELESSSWKFELPLADCGERILAIYMDTHGNEFRETIELTKLKAPRKRSKAVVK
ncbi:MAG: site-specific DNA-methyltransferase [Solirubrobacterales bacterium]